MKNTILIALCAALLTAVLLRNPVAVHAQDPDLTPLTINAVDPTLTHTSCKVKANVTRTCFPFDGVWVSENGAAYMKVGGVTSLPFTQITGVATPAQLPAISAITGKLVAAQFPASFKCTETITIPSTAWGNGSGNVVLTAVSAADSGCL